MKVKLRTSQNYVATEGIRLSSKSETVPDSSYSITDLIRKYSSGAMPPVMRDGHYPDEDPSFRDVLRTDLDIVDVQEELEDIQKRNLKFGEFKKEYETRSVAEQEKKKKDAMRSEILNELQSKEDTKMDTGT